MSSKWNQFRLWNTKQNLLQKSHSKPQEAYSSSQTCCGCLLPISCFVCFIGYLIFITGNEDDMHYVLTKDADVGVGWRLSHGYFENMYQALDIVYQPSYAQTANDYDPQLTFYQYYRADGQRRTWDCNDVLDENPLNISLSDENGYTASSTLCYHEMWEYPGYQYQGLSLCRNDADDNGTETLHINIDYAADDRVTNRVREHLSQIYHWESEQSIIFTVQLWQMVKWGSTGGFSGEWEGNQLEIKHVEYSNNQQLIPQPVSQDEMCYGVRINMERIVYEVHDGHNNFIFYGGIFAFIGAIYSFLLLLFGNCAKCMDIMCGLCCKSFYEKDKELPLNDTNEENIEMERTTATNM